MASDPKVYVFEEVAKHNKTNDCWLIINGKVYDVSSFMDEHPGGDEVLLAATGKDATDDFEENEHSKEARAEMGKFCIGEINRATVPVKRPYPYALPKSSYKLNQTSDPVSTILQFSVPLLVLGLFYAVRRYTTEE